MTVSINDLLTLPTKEEMLDKFVGLLRLAGFPTASWQTASFLRHTVESESALFVDLFTSIRQIGKGGFIKLAVDLDDSWVDLCAENVFAETRKPAVYTQGTVVLTDAANNGPTTINVGAFWVANADKSVRFVNTTGGSLPLGGSLPITVQAESAGSDWNLGNGAIVELLTPLPGVTVSNPALDTGTWITQQGANVETSAALAQRCLDKWSMLGSGSDEGAYRYLAASASSEITRVNAYSPGAGAVRVIVAGDGGPVSTSALGLASTAVFARRPTGVPDVQTLNCGVNATALTGVLSVTAGVSPSATLAAAQASLNAFARALPIGSKVSREKVIKALLVDGVDDIELVTPVDFTLLATEVWVPTFSLTAVTA